MAKVSKAIVDKNLRDRVFTMIANGGMELFEKVNDRQYGIILIDMNGEQRYIRLGAIVTELRDDMTAEELMQSEIDAYNQKQADKAEKAQKKAEKIKADKAKREAKAKEGEQE